MRHTGDTLRKFLFENAPIRGEVVHLTNTWQSVITRHAYPAALRDLMGQLCAAAVLLAATLKLKGALVLQIQGKGAIKLLVVECTGNLEVRATAKWEGALASGGLREWVGEGRFVITLDPKDGGQAYQGIVALEGDTVAQILENYMTRSEQLDTRLWLAADDRSAGGMLLQKLPEQKDMDADAWTRVVHLGGTLADQELLELPAETLIHRLYHEEDVRLFDAQPVVFECSCSRENVSRMLKMLGRQEVDEILAEQGEIEVFCEFCNQRYQFDSIDAQAVFTDTPAVPHNATRH